MKKSLLYSLLAIHAPVFSNLTLPILVDQFRTNGKRAALINPLAQFGTTQRPLLGASILPVRLDPTMLPGMSKTFSSIKYRTVIATPGSRFSRPVMVGNQLTGSYELALGFSQVASQIDTSIVNALNLLIEQGNDIESVARITRWFDTVITQALNSRLEKDRWDAIVAAQITRTGANGLSELVSMPNASGQRVAVGGTWSNDTYNPFDDIAARINWFADRGMNIARIITSRRVVGILAGNDKMKQFAAGSTTAVTPFLSLEDLNRLFAANALPPLELYETRYSTEDTTARYLADDVMVFVAETGRDEIVDLGDAKPINLPNTIGNTILGVVLGESGAGAASNIEYTEKYPPALYAEGMQESAPYLEEPEAFSVITGIA